MPSNNILANLFTTLFNTEDRRKDNCIVVPTSKLGIEVLNTLKKEGYIGDFEHIDDKRGGKFKIKLLAKISKCGAITPRKKKEFGRGSRWCKRCGDYTALIQKYDLHLCRRCFREVANSLGFRKNG